MVDWLVALPESHWSVGDQDAGAGVGQSKECHESGNTEVTIPIRNIKPVLAGRTWSDSVVNVTLCKHTSDRTLVKFGPPGDWQDDWGEEGEREAGGTGLRVGTGLARAAAPLGG